MFGERNIERNQEIKQMSERDRQRMELQQIQGPLDVERGEEKVADNIESIDSNEDWRHVKRILSMMSGRGWNDYLNAGVNDVKKFAEYFPTPLDFEEPSERFMKKLGEKNNEQTMQGYARAMEIWKKMAYGAKQERWEMMKKEEADRKDGERRFGAEDVATRLREVNKLFGAHDILKNTVLENDEYGPDIDRGRLGIRDLEKMKLGPEYEFELEGVEYKLSRSFGVNGRRCMIGYIHTPGDADGVYHARSYYLSGSQGVWRYLPDYTVKNSEANWYGKAQGEEALTLPSEAQDRMFEVDHRSQFREQNGKVKALSREEREFAFFGTAKVINEDMRSYKQKRVAGEMGDALSREVKGYASLKASDKIRPEDMWVVGGLAPDFGNRVHRMNAQSDIYGEYRIDVYNSEDKELRWMMCVNNEGECWIGGIEKKSPIGTTGLRQEWVHGGAMTTPLYEYDSQDGGYGDATDRKGSYVSMWKNFWSKTRFAQEYKKSMNRR